MLLLDIPMIRGHCRTVREANKPKYDDSLESTHLLHEMTKFVCGSGVTLPL